MKRLSNRTIFLLILMGVLVLGLGFFTVRYFLYAGEWVTFQGSPHVYSGSNLSSGKVTDRDGVLLLDSTDGRVYAEDPVIRAATMHLLGDRYGYISAPVLTEYADYLVGFNPVNGIFGQNQGANTAVLSISAQVQKVAYEALGNYHGTVGVYNYKTGEILCAVTSPSYDPDNMPDVEGDQTGAYDGVYLNRFFQTSTVPGSIFKIVTAAAGLEAGVVDLDDHFNCPGFRIVEDRKIRCHKTGGHGGETFLEGMMNSCNPVLIDVGQRLGVERYYGYFEQFGLLGKTGIDLPGEASTIMHKMENMGAVELATVSFGQSFQVTPVQLAATVSAVINGGTRVTPHLGVRAVSADGTHVREFSWPEGEQILSEETSGTMRYILEQVVAEGSGKNAAVPGFRIGGKTATSEKLPRSLKKYISSFIGFAPADDPEVLALITIDEPQGVYYGGTIAAPVIADIFENILPYLGIQAEEEETVSAFRIYG